MAFKAFGAMRYYMRIRPSTHGFYAKNYLFSTLLAVILFFSGIYMAFETGELLISIGLVVLGSLLIAIGIVHSVVNTKSTVLYLEENKLVYETGILSHHKKIAPLSMITDSTIERTFFERIVGVGDLHINTSGTAGIEILANDFNFEDVEKIHKQIYEIINANARAGYHRVNDEKKE